MSAAVRLGRTTAGTAAAAAVELARCRARVAAEPRSVDALNGLAIALARVGLWEEARGALARTIEVDPGNARARNNLGSILRQLGRDEEAMASFERAVRLAPDYAEAHGNRAVALCRLGRYAESLESYAAALALDPANADVHYNRGNALTVLERYEEAIASYEKAVALEPGHGEAHNNLGNAQARLRRFEAALASYERALALRPDSREASNNRGTALLNLGRFAEAAAHYEELIGRQPQFAEAHSNLAIALQGLQRHPQALVSFDRAISLRADYADARWNKGLLKLALGELREGWRLCAAGFAAPGRPADEAQLLMRRRREPTLLAGTTVLLSAGEGFGDTIQFSRYALEVRALGARVILQVQPGLKALLRSLEGADELIGWDEPAGPSELHCPLMNVPLALGTDLDNIPRAIPYLRADPELRDRWGRRLPTGPALRVGIAWQGNPLAEARLARGRSVPLRCFGALARLPDVRLVSLQKGAVAEELAFAGLHNRVLHFADLDRGEQAFLDTAAVMMSLDLVVTCDTSIAHLAGALGVPVWVALHATPDWRWLLARSDSPWYPTMRLFRQPEPGNWDAVFAQIAAELPALVV